MGEDIAIFCKILGDMGDAALEFGRMDLFAQVLLYIAIFESLTVGIW